MWGGTDFITWWNEVSDGDGHHHETEKGTRSGLSQQMGSLTADGRELRTGPFTHESYEIQTFDITFKGGFIYYIYSHSDTLKAVKYFFLLQLRFSFRFWTLLLIVCYEFKHFYRSCNYLVNGTVIFLGILLVSEKKLLITFKVHCNCQKPSFVFFL